MNGIKKFLFYALVVLSTGLIVITLLSLIYNLKFWYSKILDFPRLQYLILGISFLVLFVIFNTRWKFPSVFLLAGLLSVILIHGMVVLPYWIGEKSVPDYLGDEVKKEDSFGLLLANVLIDNRQSEAFLEMVDRRDPDIVLAMETDAWWMEKLQVLKEKYPHHMEYPLDNAYGMMLYSKLPMDDRTIKFLQHDDVPSFNVTMKLPSGKSFNFHGIHPVAPVPSGKYPDNVGGEEVELAKIGNLVAGHALPSLVAGDFNDVSWSHTSRLFEEDGNLNNVRIGRGLYNTFDATSSFFRWPLDHFFVTKEFKVVELERLEEFGSDHYALYGRFVLGG